ncbi:lipase maturation factor family protein [Halorientalis regularis]|uniref:Lipase maturation factor n=1 Tax=Halorientalis regularis TaxID=660518 RepID=A0A1G7FBL7_9EURY|nr:lipase maturation factor family protein [Halorientalis regularis]SDE73234.1 Lipase maturation factor [Halorientalis regularis]
MELLDAGGYWYVRFLLQRGLALLYLVAFLVAASQFRALVGEDGLLPIEGYIEAVEFRDRPSLFYFYPSDRVVGLAAWTGVGLAVSALLGVPYLLPEPWPLVASVAIWALLWGLYQSFVNAGRIFYGYGWESMLLETGFLAIFLGAGATGPPVLVIWLVKWALFRNMFGAGLIKMRGDDCWRELTCMDYHYETQPMPNPLSWYAHHLPDRFHRVEVLGNHVVELAIPFLYFAPQPYAAIGGLATIGFQLWLMLTGNFAWLNALTAVQGLTTFSDGVLTTALPLPAASAAPAPLPLQVASVLVATLVVALSGNPVRNMLSTSQTMNTAFDPLHLVNTYGAFGSITTRRYQLVVEGTRADDPDEDDWRAYEFEGQPVRTDERPPQWAPYHLRLDWQLWFAAMQPRPGRRQRWFTAFLADLLENDGSTLSLLRSNPFPDEPPEKVRVRRFRYRYTTPEERAETGEWWERDLVGIYVHSTSLSELRSPTGGRRPGS